MHDIKVTHVMADGTICNDLSTYLDMHKLPNEVICVLKQLMFGPKPDGTDRGWK